MTLFQVENIESIPSPSLVFFEELIDQNLDEMIRLAGDPVRLRPHCKTHKTREIIEKLLKLGIHKHKCSTLTEAELLANTGVKDIFLSYNIVGPNIQRLGQFRTNFPEIELTVTADDPTALEQLSEEMEKLETSVGVALDLDSGLKRTGIAPGNAAVELYEIICSSPGITPGGLHWYDGQHRQTDLFERKTAVEEGLSELTRLKDRLLMNGFRVPRTVVGGTGSFPIHAEHTELDLEPSPGTVLLFDAGYQTIYPELNFKPAAAVLSRVVSRPGSTRATFDVGSKAIAPDSPLGSRTHFPALPGAQEIMHNEEHLVIDSPDVQSLKPGDHQWVVPWHICPTCALHSHAIVVREGKVLGKWRIAARDRSLSFLDA